MITLLFTILIVLIVSGLLYWAVTMLPLPAQVKQIATVVVVLIMLVWLLQVVGVFGAPWRVRM